MKVVPVFIAPMWRKMTGFPSRCPSPSPDGWYADEEGNDTLGSIATAAGPRGLATAARSAPETYIRPFATAGGS
jgi:hypothetical protein